MTDKTFRLLGELRDTLVGLGAFDVLDVLAAGSDEEVDDALRKLTEEI